MYPWFGQSISCIGKAVLKTEVCPELPHVTLNPNRKLQECLREHGGGEVGQIWFDGAVLLFLVNFHTKLALSKLLAGQSEVEKKLMTELQSMLLPFGVHAQGRT